MNDTIGFPEPDEGLTQEALPPTVTGPATPTGMAAHPFSAWSFLFGVLFVLTAAGWAAFEAGVLGTDALLAGAPITLIVLGLGGLVLTFVRRTPTS